MVEKTTTGSTLIVEADASDRYQKAQFNRRYDFECDGCGSTDIVLATDPSLVCVCTECPAWEIDHNAITYHSSGEPRPISLDCFTVTS